MLSLERPKTWSEVVGQESTVKELRSRLQPRDKFPQVVLLSGPTGIGKSSCAVLAARTLVCERPVDGGPCNECSTCQRTLKEAWESTDVVLVDSTKVLAKSDLIEQLEETLAYEPQFGDRKVILIEEVQDLMAKYQNTFLKMLEAQIDHAVFIFTTMEVGKLGKAFRQRCQQYTLKVPSHVEVAQYLFTLLPPDLLSNEQFLKETIFLIAEAGENSYRGALQVLDRVIASGFTTPEQVKEEFAIVSEASIQTAFRSILSGSADSIPLIRKEGSSFFFKSMHFLFRVKQAQLTGNMNDDASGVLGYFAAQPFLNRLFSLYRTVLERGYSDDVFMMGLYELVTEIQAYSRTPAGVQVRPTRPTGGRA